MPVITIPKKSIPKKKVKRDLKAMEALFGIWREKKIKDPVAWQKKIRKEWERNLP